jgi:hypothetical protein
MTIGSTGVKFRWAIRAPNPHSCEVYSFKCALMTNTIARMEPPSKESYLDLWPSSVSASATPPPPPTPTSASASPPLSTGATATFTWAGYIHV